MNARELFGAGDLRQALEVCNQEVRAAPEDAARRSFLFELLAFAGDLDRAEKQLEVVAHLDSKSEPAVQVYRNILFAERLRRKVLGGEAQPEFLRDAPPYAHRSLEALRMLRAGDAAGARAALDQALGVQPPMRGSIGDRPFEGIRDCDDTIAPFLELIVLRDYVWLPFENIRELEVLAPERPRDLVWAPVRLQLDDGTQRRGYVPVLYAGSHESSDDQIRLGRFTDWVTPEVGPVRGLGHRMLMAGDEGYPLLEIRSAVFSPAA